MVESEALVLEMNNQTRDEIADFVRILEGYNSGQIQEEVWMKRRLWQGIYGQRQKGVQMIRIKFPYGIGNTKQFRAVAEIARTETNSILHLTTRSAIQIHFIPRNSTPQTLKALADVGLTSREACGNTARNVTCSPFAGLSPDDKFNVIPLARLVFKHCLRNPYSQNFPRKFKISLSGADETDHGLSFIHDIGIVATMDGQRKGLNIYAAGGLGGRGPRRVRSDPCTPIKE